MSDLKIIRYEINYQKKGEDDDAPTIFGRADIREEFIPWWASVVIRTVSMGANLLGVNPEYVVIELFNSNQQENSYKEAKRAGK